ncbi:uncharacterized protein LOC117332163 [Pecten maximus]|uniref:uncharacterized protein LOC117332163 n=1 Tax=Pecten maximus TaxID=6579 RepID=UPI001458DF75|nr:uncharacterized protein LOC117332163 [Pecten maximus]
MARGDCCPDVYFALPPMACVNTTLLITTSPTFNLEPKPPSYEVVNSCPPGAGNKDRNLCEKTYTIKELLTRPPVASTTFPVSYRNKHCAKCNGENATTNWILDIDCLVFADFNFLSTYEEIIDLARKRQCRMRYSPMHSSARPCNLTINDNDLIIRSCNVTGSWEMFDHTIELACESTYHLQFREYKNVFCYMCNPHSHMSDDVIDQCNTTGMWYPYDAGLKRACMYHSTSQNTRPFKNIFCYLCNRIANDNETFYDVTTNISDIILKSDRHNVYDYVIRTGQLRPEHIRYTFIELQNNMVQNNSDWHFYPHGYSETDLVIKKKDVQLNVTNLVYKQFAVRPFDQFCDKTIIPLQYVLVYFRTCTCRPTCLFQFDGICCLDFALTYPVSCMDNYVPQAANSKKQFLVTDGCWQNRGHPTIRNRCVSDNQTDLISFLPLIKRFDNTYYKNFDCYLCNANVDEIYPTYRIENIVTSDFYLLSDIHIICDSVLDYIHLVSFMDVINLSKNINCSVRFDLHNPYNPDVKCSTSSKSDAIDKCNVTGNWPVYDPDVIWACEEASSNSLPGYKKFKNFYCYLCNPENSVTGVISSCNETGQWQKYNINHEKACHLFPRIYSYPHYKNLFCELCNSATIPNITGNVMDDVSDTDNKGPTLPLPPFDVTFRSIFSVAEYDDTVPEVEGERCRKDQIYDYWQVGFFKTDFE